MKKIEVKVENGSGFIVNKGWKKAPLAPASTTLPTLPPPAAADPVAVETEKKKKEK